MGERSAGGSVGTGEAKRRKRRGGPAIHRTIWTPKRRRAHEAIRTDPNRPIRTATNTAGVDTEAWQKRKAAVRHPDGEGPDRRNRTAHDDRTDLRKPVR